MVLMCKKCILYIIVSMSAIFEQRQLAILREKPRKNFIIQQHAWLVQSQYSGLWKVLACYGSSSGFLSVPKEYPIWARLQLFNGGCHGKGKSSTQESGILMDYPEITVNIITTFGCNLEPSVFFWVAVDLSSEYRKVWNCSNIDLKLSPSDRSNKCKSFIWRIAAPEGLPMIL